jgi:hypothetical protein
VNVTNEEGCVVSANVTISSPYPLTNTFNYADATNQQGNNGWISINPFGGSAPYTYSWSNGATQQTITDLSPGVYTVTISDSMGCSITENIQINQDECASLQISLVSESPSCFGGSSGSATVYSDSYNLKLSQKRAEEAVNYIIGKGISKTRITAKGYGESKLLNRCKNGINCSEEDHQFNRRTEFKVTRIFKSKLRKFPCLLKDSIEFSV